MDANFIQVMEQVVGGLFVQDVGEGEHNKDGEVDPLSVMEEAKDGEEEQSWSLSSLEGEVANHNNQQCGGQGHGGRGRGQGQGRSDRMLRMQLIRYKQTLMVKSAGFQLTSSFLKQAFLTVGSD
jgi:hypothetical protein